MNTQNAPVVFITGGGQGIGFGIATCFARKGYRVALADAKTEILEAAEEKLQKEGTAQTLGVTCDITQRDQVESAVAKVLGTYGRIDVLVNNAGICPFVDIMEMQQEMFEKVMDVNLTGAFHCTQVVGRHMAERAESGDAFGRVIFITSLADRFSQPCQVEYAASKSGLKGLMFGFATALAKHGVTCNAIAPGMIMTPLTEHHWSQPGPAEQIKTAVPVGRIGTPIDIGNAAVFLASPEAAYVNGITLTVDGGFSVLIKG